MIIEEAGDLYQKSCKTAMGQVFGEPITPHNYNSCRPIPVGLVILSQTQKIRVHCLSIRGIRVNTFSLGGLSFSYHKGHHPHQNAGVQKVMQSLI
jgi:hypothetical protein